MSTKRDTMMDWDNDQQEWVGDVDGYRVYVDGDEMAEAVAQAERDGLGSDFLYDPAEWLSIRDMENPGVRVEKLPQQ